VKLLATDSIDLSVMGQLLITFSVFGRHETGLQGFSTSSIYRLEIEAGVQIEEKFQVAF
jgi:hypothetical protein